MASFGVVVFNDLRQVLLRRSSGGYGGVEWSFAKGQPDAGESPTQTAEREALEELGYKVRLIRPLGMFPSANGYENHYFLAKAIAGPLGHDYETAEVRWVSIPEARRLLKLSGEKYNNWATVKRDLDVLESAVMLSKNGTRLNGLGVVEYTDQSVNPLAHFISGPQGGNEGGWFKGSDGVLRYIKFPRNPQQSIVECLSNHLYRDLGVYVPQCYIFETDADGESTIAYASIAIPGYKDYPYRPSKQQAEDFMQGFAVDVLTANWDGAGRNCGLDGSGRVVRVDQGGSLVYRAMGELKREAQQLNVSEHQTFFTSNLFMPTLMAAGVYNWDETARFVNPMIDKIVELRDRFGGWDNYVEKNAPMLDPYLQDMVARMLQARTNWLVANRPRG